MIKRDFLDAAFSDLIREAADWMCQRCHKPFPERKGRDLQCSHFISRGAGKGLRWNVDNACALCGACHTEVGRDPDLHTAFFRRIVGETRFLELKKAKLKTVKISKDDKKAMAKHFREETARIAEMRMRGHQGYIAPVPWQ